MTSWKVEIELCSLGEASLSVYEPNKSGHGGHYVNRMIKKRLTKKQYLIVARGAAKSMYSSTIQSFFLNIDPDTTHQITTAPTMRQAEEVMSPIRTSIVRARGPLFKFLGFGLFYGTFYAGIQLDVG